MATPAKLSGRGPASGCSIHVERWEGSCFQKTTEPDRGALDRVLGIVVDFDRFSLARRQRDRDHLAYRSSETFGPQFSHVVMEPRTRAFNLGLHLRFEYAF